MVDILKTKTLGSSLTSYDLLKSLAIILMVIDHIGYFFYPEEAWFRIIGRLSVPIWFYLIGFSSSRDVPKLFWIGGLAVLLSSMVAGEYVFPLNILFALIWARLAIDWIMVRALRNYEAFAGMFFLLFLLGIPSLVFVEYGTMGFLFAMFGYMRRHKENLKIKPLAFYGFLAASIMAYVLVQSVLMSTLTMPQFFVLVGGMIALFGLLHVFEAKEFQKRFVFTPVLQFCGRRTLEIYVVHLVIFRGVAMATDPERFSFFDFDIFAFKQVLALFA